MLRLFKRKEAVILVCILIFVVGFLFFKNFSAKAQEQIKIFSTVFSGDWQNPQAVFSQDLSESATFEEFSAANSAYPLEILGANDKKQETGEPTGFWNKVKNFFKETASAQEENQEEGLGEEEQLPEEELPEEPVIEEPVIEEPIIEEPIIEEPIIEEPVIEEKILPVEKILELSNFSLSDSFEGSRINNVQLRFSLAGKGEAGDKLIIKYQFQNSWQPLAEFDLENEISNAKNGGYFLYALAVFENWEDLENLKIRFQVSGSNSQEVYLDAVWLELEYEKSEVETRKKTSELNSEDKAKLKELEIEEIKGKYAFKSLDNDVIEIGVERHSPPQPYLKLGKWDGEVSLKVSIPFKVNERPDFVGEKIRYKTQENNPKVAIEFYPREPEEITETINGKDYTFKQIEDGGVEFDTIFYEKPETNEVVFPIETEGLNFYYQPPLNEEIGGNCTETYCLDEKGNITDFRPENVVGSYAVYHATKKDHIIGEKNYMAGKAFHIYRPLVTDSEGNEIWAEVKISDGKLIITIDQNWLDNAVYPMAVDPTFGYTTAGGSSTANPNYIKGSWAAGGTGKATSITASHSSSGTFKYALYTRTSATAGSLVAQTAEGTLGSGAPQQWVARNFATPQTVSSSTNYWLFTWYSGSLLAWRDTGASQQAGYLSRTYDGTYPATVSLTAQSNLYSIYCTYSVAPTVDSVSISPSPITLNADTTKTVTITATITDNDGCEDVFTSGSITGVFYDAAAESYTCTQDDNDCYTSLTLTEVDNTCTGAGDYTADASADVSVWFVANPSSSWTARVTATDAATNSASNTSTVTINTLLALDVTGGPINYDTVLPGQNTGSTNQQVTVYNIGNVAADVRLYGTDITWSGNNIDASYQEYSLSPFTYGAGNDLKEGPAYDDVNVDLPKPTAHSPSNSSDIFYWGLGVSSPMPASTDYAGTNTFEVINAL